VLKNTNWKEQIGIINYESKHQNKLGMQTAKLTRSQQFTFTNAVTKKQPKSYQVDFIHDQSYNNAI